MDEMGLPIRESLPMVVDKLNEYGLRERIKVICSGKRAYTPGSIPLRQSKSHACQARKDGFKSKTFRVRSGTSWKGFGHSTATNTAAWGWWTLGIGTAIGWSLLYFVGTS